MKSVRLAVSMLTLGGSVVCSGGDLSDQPVGPRISLAKDRILVFTDTIARQASVAYPTAASANPAADDFLRRPPVDYDGYGLFITSEVLFEDSGYTTGYAGIGAVRLPEAGAITVAVVRLDSHGGVTNQDDHIDIRSNEVFLGYSHRLSETLSLGGEIHLTDSTLEIESFPGFPLETASDTLGVGFDLGVMAAISETVTVGLHGGMKWDRSETDGVATLPGPPDGPGPLPVDITDTALITDLRAGVGWRPVEHWGLYADGQWVHYGDDSATIDIGRVYVGSELFLSKNLALRVGTVVDTQPQIGVSAGLGYYGIARMPIELGYAYNTFPEVRKEFGRAHLFSLSFVLLF
jgi:hypothetical protein